MGWDIPEVEENLEPVVADQRIKTEHFDVLPGQTRGLHQIVQGRATTGQTIHLDLKMYLDAPDQHDFIQIEGDPSVSCRVENGIAGDIATVAALVNCIPRLLAAGPGVRLMTDIPLSGISGVPVQKQLAMRHSDGSLSEILPPIYD
jgi:4-hydroxy-tetrahydrodipicolinate reductase